jgi:hypothetical protein
MHNSIRVSWLPEVADVVELIVDRVSRSCRCLWKYAFAVWFSIYEACKDISM